MTEERFQMKWWGWGHKDVRYSLQDHPGVAQFVRQRFGLQLDVTASFAGGKPDISAVKLPPSRLSPEAKQALVACVGNAHVADDAEKRLIHSYGKGYKDLLRMRTQSVSKAVDVVVSPASPEEIRSVLEVCQAHGIAVIPFGGGSSVVSGLEPDNHSHKAVASLVLTRLNKILSIDKDSQTAVVQAGIFGPALEEALKKEGFTFGHFPQSFEFSTLGGWIAARSSGQNSIYYGGIEKRIVSLELISPQGEVRTLTVPRKADGPDLKEMILGSEGTLGVVTAATLRLSKAPEHQHYFMLAFPSFDEAQQATRLIAQSPLRPAMVRVSDEAESEAFFVMGRKPATGLAGLGHTVADGFLKWRGVFPPHMSAMIVGFEGEEEANALEAERLRELLSGYRAVYLGRAPGKNWLKNRFFLPYLRDEFLNQKLLIDTLETSTEWSKLLSLHAAVRDALITEAKAQGSQDTFVMCHISHAYSDGASLYFTFVTPQKSGDELAQWEGLKRAANRAIQNQGGAISHHHGIGIDHKDHLPWSPFERKIMENLKQTFDPSGLLNPGKLI